MLTITQFRKKYPGNANPVLSIDKLELNAGAYWLKGENGSGKTSLLKSVAGLIPFEGNIMVNDLNIHKNRMDYTKIVNYAEAEPLYPSFLTGGELVNFYTKIKGGKFPEQLFIQLGVEKFMDNKTATYSSGMVKKLSLVLGFIGNPLLVLLDEPLIALDSVAATVLQACIAAYCRQGVSFLITSHQQLDNNLLPINGILHIQDKILMTEKI